MYFLAISNNLQIFCVCVFCKCAVYINVFLIVYLRVGLEFLVIRTGVFDSAAEVSNGISVFFGLLLTIKEIVGEQIHKLWAAK